MALSALLNVQNLGPGNVLTFWSDLTSLIDKGSPFFLRHLFHFNWEGRPERLHHHGHCRTRGMRRRGLVLIVTAGPRFRPKGNHLCPMPDRVSLFVPMVPRVEKRSCLVQ